MTDELNHEKTSYRLLKADEVAFRLNISSSEAYHLVDMGDIPGIRIGKRSIRVDERDLEEYILKCRNKEKHVSTFSAKIYEQD
jgi:excisionase family DNA binding protein